MSAYRFDRCLLSPLRRELLIDGHRVEVQPLIFDLLLYLAQRAGQVIDKDLLLSEVWRSPHVSESVVARAIMKARRAIGDDSRDPRVLRTVPRVGYQLACPVRAVPDLAASPSPSPNPSPFPPHPPRAEPRAGLVLLPFVNTTGDPEVERLSRGLVRLLQHLLQSRPGRTMAQVTLAEARRGNRPAADADALAEACSHSGSREALLCKVAGSGGRFTLSAQRGASAASATRHVCTGDDVVQLVLHLTRALEPAAVAPDGCEVVVLQDPGAEQSPEASEQSDGFWAEQLARALELVDRGLLGPAADLLQVCGPYLRSSLTLELLHARVARFGGMLARSQTHGLAALRLARETRSPELQLQALDELAATAFSGGDDTAALQCCEEALELARAHAGARTRVAGVMTTLAGVHNSMGRSEQGVLWAERAAAAAASAGNLADELQAQAMLAMCLLSAGHGARARELLQRVLDQARRAHLLQIEVVAVHFMSRVQARRLHLHPALELARRAQTLAVGAGHVFVRQQARAMELGILVKLGRVDEARQGLKAVVMADIHLPLTRVLYRQAHANALWREGQREQAVQEQRLLLAEPGPARDHGWFPVLHELALNLISLGHLDEAETALRQAGTAPLPGPLSRIWAALALARGDRPAALALLKQAWARLPPDDTHGMLLAHDLGWMLLEDGALDALPPILSQVQELAPQFLPARVLCDACAAVRGAAAAAGSAGPGALACAPELARNFPCVAEPGYVAALRAGTAPRLTQLLVQACR